MTEDAKAVSDWVRNIIDIPGYATATGIAVLLGVPVERVREAVRMTPVIQPVATVAIYDVGSSKEIKRRIFEGEDYGTDDGDGEAIPGEPEDDGGPM
ncbi:MAG: hypothetical protein WCY09_08465 [Candidatus Omnitrophota bacterium]